MPDTTMTSSGASLSFQDVSEFTAAISPRDMAIENIQSKILDVPTTRLHKLSNTRLRHQSYVMVSVTLKNGITGYGEASTLGGPRWAEESVESIKAAIDIYLAPVIRGEIASGFEKCALLMGAAATRNYSAKSAIEAALYDAVGKTLSMPASALLGGAVRQSIPVIWALASGDADQEIEEAKLKLERRQMRDFKIKFGFLSPQDDIARLRKIVDALPDTTRFVVDVNQGWSEATAIQYLPALAELNVALIEQPLPASQVEALARIASRIDIPVLIDEGAFTLQEIRRAGVSGAGSVLSLKLVKSGGLMELKRAAGVASSCGMQLYGGCLLESGIGVSAHMAVYSTLPALEWGTEHFGPLILQNDLVSSGIVYENFDIKCPTGPGLGVTIAEDVVREYTRKGQ